MLELPRSIRLAAWGSAVLRGTAEVPVAVRAVTAEDEPHEIDDAPGSGLLGPGAGLSDLLNALSTLATPGLWVVLPAPGDVLGLPGPPPLNAAAVEAGEAVLAEPGIGVGPVALVPQITPFGSEHEPGTLVTWQLFEAGPRRVTDVGSLGEAERALREGLREATEELARLDVPRWREDAADRLDAMRHGELAAGSVPPDVGGRAARVLAMAARLRLIVEIAGADDGGSVSGHEARGRSQALRGLDGVCRRAMVAAVNAWAELDR